MLTTQQEIPIARRAAEAVRGEPAPAELPSNYHSAPPLPSIDRRRLGPMVAESFWTRRAFELCALVLAGVFATLIFYNWVPAHGGVDQNGYLVGGKMMSRTGTTKFAPRDPDEPSVVDPYQFVGLMWVGIDLGKETERFYPKYPIGLPALVASTFVVGGEKWGSWLTFWINPICMTLAVLGTFFLARCIVGSFGAVLAEALFATSPVTLGLTNNPSSHASTVCFVVWGMFLLLRWWQSRGAWRAALAGFLLGYAYTIRYTEGLLVLPIVAVVLLAMRWRELRSWVEGGLLLTWWAIPVLALTVFNLKAMGTFTGYDPTNESWGFSLAYFFPDNDFAGNWDSMLRQFNHTGLILTFSLALLGMGWMWIWNWRTTLLLWLWIVPNCFIYAIYYWAPDGHWTGYMRFFLTVFPALIICAVWAAMQGARLCAGAPEWVPPVRLWRSALPRLAIGGVVTLAVLLNIYGSLPSLEGEHRNQLFLARAMSEIQGGDGKRPDTVPPGSVIFSHDHLLHQLQFSGDYLLYSPQVFNASLLRGRITNQDQDEPHPLHRERSRTIIERLGDDLDQKEQQEKLTEAQKRIITESIKHHRRVFFIFPNQNWNRRGQTPEQAMINSMNQLLPGGASWIRSTYDLKVIAQWNNDTNVVRRLDGPRRNAARKRVPTVRPAPPQLQSWMLVEVTEKPPPPRGK